MRLSGDQPDVPRGPRGEKFAHPCARSIMTRTTAVYNSRVIPTNYSIQQNALPLDVIPSSDGGAIFNLAMINTVHCMFTAALS